MSRRIKGITIVLNAETTGLDKALKDVNDRSSDINEELRDTNRLLRFSPDSAELMAQKQKLLGDQVAATSEKLETLRKVEGQVAAQAKSGEIGAKQYRDFQKEIIQTESQLKHYEKLLRDVDSATVKLGKSMQETGQKLKDSGQNLADVGKSLTKGVTVPVAAIGTLATKSAIEFETGMAGVRKTTDMTTDELEEMGQALRDMAKEIPVSVNDLTELAETAGQLGIEKENLVSFTRVMADLAVATNIAGQEGATSMAQFANITQMSQKDFDRMGATIVELGNNTATTERDILNMATRLAAAGKQASMSQSDILGIAAGLASLGLEAQAGGSAFSKVINQIQLSVDTGSEDLEDYARVAGMSAETFASAWGEDAAGALSKFIIGLGDTERHGQSTNEILDELGITELRMGDALRRTSGANELFNDTLAMSNRAWAENIALTTEASILYETTQSKLTIAKNKLNDTAIELGNNLLPVISDVAEWAGSLVEKFTDLSPKTQSLIIKMGAFAAALGPVLTIGGNLKKLFGTVSDGIGKLIEKIGHGVGALGGFTTGGAVGTAIAGIGALVGAIALLASTYESTTTKIYDLIKATEESAKAFQTTISDMEAANAETKSLGDRYFELAEKTRLSNAEQEELKWISEDLVKVMPELNELLDKETGLLKMGKDAWEEYFDAKSEHDKQKADYERRKELALEHNGLLEKLAIARRELAEAEAEYGDSTALDAAKRLRQLRDNIDLLVESLGINREAWADAGGQTEEGARRAEWAAGMIKYAYGDVADAADEVVDRIGGAQRHYNETEKEFTDRLEASTKHREEIIEREKKAREDYFKDIEKGTEDNLKSMSGFSKKRLDLSKTTTSEFINHLIEEREAFNNYHENLKIIAERVGPDVAAELEKLGPDAAPLIDDFVKDTGTALEELAEIFGLRLDDANRVAEEKAKELNGAKYGADFIQGLIDGMEGKRAALKAKAASLSAEIIGSTVATLEERSPSRIAMESGANWVKGLEIGLESRRKELAEKAESLANEINTATKEANEQLQIDLKKFDADYEYDREKAVRDYTKSVANIRERASKENRKLTKDEHWDLADLERSHKQDMIDMEVRYQDDRLKLISQASIDVVAAGEKHVEQQKWIGEMSLYEEGIYWNAMYLSLEKGTDAYERALSNHQSAVARMRSEMESATEKYSSQVKKIDESLARETERINKNYENESKRINDQRIRDSEEVRKKLESDIQSLQDAYQNAYENRVSQLTNITGLFDKYQRKTAVPETALIRHLESQVDALKDYSSAMESVKDRVDNEDLIAELEKLGPNSLAELEAINRMTDDQLAEFVGLYEERFRLANEQATEELAPLKTDTEKQILELKDAAQRSLQEINRVANQELAQLESDMRAQLQELNNTATEELKALENEWLQIVSDIIGGSEKQFDSMRNVGLEAIGKLEMGLLDGESSLMTEANRIANNVQSVIASALNIPESSLPDSNAGIAAGQLSKLGAGTGGGTSVTAGAGRAAAAGGVTQHITINSPDPLTPSEVARQTKNASQQLAMEW